ncbi:hypothetical protein F5Y03DRAFT_400633 [Xylaria venustula]|nr:hypothetical protein F5Y03DRAFT_400633 [Xylaria venustula]
MHNCHIPKLRIHNTAGVADHTPYHLRWSLNENLLQRQSTILSPLFFSALTEGTTDKEQSVKGDSGNGGHSWKGRRAGARTLVNRRFSLPRVPHRNMPTQPIRTEDSPKQCVRERDLLLLLCDGLLLRYSSSAHNSKHPYLRPRELESLNSDFLPEISILRASLSGKKAGVLSPKPAVADAETLFGECMEKLREIKGVKEVLVEQQKSWGQRGREMESVLREVKEEIVSSQHERYQLAMLRESLPETCDIESL